MNSKHNIDHLLQPIRITSGWKVNYNIFTEFEPTPDNMEYFYGSWLFCAQYRSVVIELRYEPEGDPRGQFILEYYRVRRKTLADQPTEVILETIVTRSKVKIVAAIERIMAKPSHAKA